MAYVDLYAGRGIYDDGTKCTPLLVIEKAISDPILRGCLRTYFNDLDTGYVDRLRSEIFKIPGIDTLTHQPRFSNFEVSQGGLGLLNSLGTIPIFSFLDPFGYKGISLELINAAIRNRGSDSVFFFNYNRMNQAAENDLFMKRVEQIFTPEHAHALRAGLSQCTQQERELVILEHLCNALKDSGPRYILPFMLTNTAGTRISHHLIFISKHPMGYEQMKEIMAKKSSSTEQGVASFEYNMATRRQPFLFRLNRPFDLLVDDLAQGFAGRSLTVECIYKEHNIGTPFVRKNYKAALSILEETGRVAINPPASERTMRCGQRTLKDQAIVIFPKL